jgi:hypothetical protein
LPTQKQQRAVKCVTNRVRLMCGLEVLVLVLLVKDIHP